MDLRNNQALLGRLVELRSQNEAIGIPPWLLQLNRPDLVRFDLPHGALADSVASDLDGRVDRIGNSQLDVAYRPVGDLVIDHGSPTNSSFFQNYPARHRSGH